MSRKANGVTYRVFLPTGEAEGLRIVTRSHWSGIAAMCSRAEIPALRARPEMLRAGVYVLVSPSENPDRPKIYIGEADVLEKRIGEHDARREEWSHAIAFASLDGSLNKAHAKNLESRLVALGQSVGRADIENKNIPQAPGLQETDTADVESFLHDMLVIFPLLGLKAFERAALNIDSSLASDSDAAIEGLVLKVGNASGKGAYRAQGFVVFKGAAVNVSTKSTLNDASQRLRRQLIEKNVLRRDGDHFVLDADQVCTSPSQAAELIMGYPVSGLERWKSASGKPLRGILAERGAAKDRVRVEVQE